jgi:small-conductance mechanosensitive channel
MNKIELLLNYFLGPLVLVAILVACLIGLNLLIVRMQEGRPERVLSRQVVMLIATFIAIFLAVILLPLGDSLRGQVLSLLGILLSAAIALSSTTFLGNALAGIMLRSVRSFRTGEFIYIKDHCGRVSGRGLFHIEIQTEDRDLVTLPNLYVATNPVKVTRSSGTIISSEVSLGYDIPHSQIKPLLEKAATATGLADPFVYILELGDFSVLYRVNGVLEDVKQLLSARSNLNGAVLDALHDAGIEIVSPNFMNTRDVSGKTFAARPQVQEAASDKAKEPEEIIFDKAEKAATIEEQKACLEEIQGRIEILKSSLAKADDEKSEKIKEVIERFEARRQRLVEKIAHNEQAMHKDKD